MNAKEKISNLTSGNSSSGLAGAAIALELAEQGLKVVINSAIRTRTQGISLLVKTAFFVSALTLPWSAACLAEEEEVLQPEFTLSAVDAKELREINRLLREEWVVHQAGQKTSPRGRQVRQIERIMAREGLKHVSPQLPKLSVISENSVLALLGQVDYTNLALKLGAPLPPRPDLPSGPSEENNRFLHAYNNLILRSIAMHLGLPVPESIDLSGEVHIAHQNFLLVRQNMDLLRSIGEKRASMQP